jgi:hypothetical protein
VDAGVRATGPIDRPARPGFEAGQRGFELSLDRPDPGSLDLEAGEVRSVVFDGGAIAPRGGLSTACLVTRRRVIRGVDWWCQTSSSWTMGAASPRRSPIFTIRV